MTKKISSFLPALPITQNYFPAKEQSTLLKVIKLAGFILALPFLLFADLLYALFYRQPAPTVKIDLPPPQLPAPEPAILLPWPSASPPLAIEEPKPPEPSLPNEPLPPESEIIVPSPPEPLKRVIEQIRPNEKTALLAPKISSLIPKITLAALGCVGLAALGYAAYHAIQSDPPPEPPTDSFYHFSKVPDPTLTLNRPRKFSDKPSLPLLLGAEENVSLEESNDFTSELFEKIDLQSAGLEPIPFFEPQDPYLNTSSVAKERFSLGQCLKRTSDRDHKIANCSTPKIPLLTALQDPAPTADSSFYDIPKQYRSYTLRKENPEAESDEESLFCKWTPPKATGNPFGWSSKLLGPVLPIKKQITPVSPDPIPANRPLFQSPPPNPPRPSKNPPINPLMGFGVAALGFALVGGVASCFSGAPDGPSSPNPQNRRPPNPRAPPPPQPILYRNPPSTLPASGSGVSSASAPPNIPNIDDFEDHIPEPVDFPLEQIMNRGIAAARSAPNRLAELRLTPKLREALKIRSNVSSVSLPEQSLLAIREFLRNPGSVASRTSLIPFQFVMDGVEQEGWLSIENFLKGFTRALAAPAQAQAIEYEEPFPPPPEGEDLDFSSERSNYVEEEFFRAPPLEKAPLNSKLVEWIGMLEDSQEERIWFRLPKPDNCVIWVYREDLLQEFYHPASSDYGIDCFIEGTDTLKRISLAILLERGEPIQNVWNFESPGEESQKQIPTPVATSSSAPIREPEIHSSQPPKRRSPPLTDLISNLMEKSPLPLDRSIRSLILEGNPQKNLLTENDPQNHLGFRQPSPNQNSWDTEKLFNELKLNLPYIHYENQTFPTTNDLVEAFFKISENDLKLLTNTPKSDIQYTKKISTLSCLTKAATDFYPVLFQNELSKAGANDVTISCLTEKPKIELAWRNKLTIIKVSYVFSIRDPKEPAPIQVEAIVTMGGEHNIQLQILPMNSSASAEESTQASFIGGTTDEPIFEANSLARKVAEWIKRFETSQEEPVRFHLPEPDNCRIRVAHDELLNALSVYSTNPLINCFIPHIQEEKRIRLNTLLERGTLLPPLRNAHWPNSDTPITGILKIPSRYKKQKPTIVTATSSSSSSSPFDDFFQSSSSSSSQEPQERSKSLKERLIDLVDKGPIFLDRSVRALILDGDPKKRNMENPPHDPFGFRNQFQWDLDKLFDNLEINLPYIYSGKRTFSSIDDLLQCFGTSENALKTDANVPLDALLPTLCYLTRPASDLCRILLRQKLGPRAGIAYLDPEQRPKIEINGRSGQTEIQIRYDFRIWDPAKESNPIDIKAILTMHGDSDTVLQILPLAKGSSDDVLTSFIGGTAATFEWEENPETEEASSYAPPPLENQKTKTWGELFAPYIPDYSTVGNWAAITLDYAKAATDYVADAIFHEPHAAHNHKYHLALNTQLAALKTRLAKNADMNNEPEDLLANLKQAYEGNPTEDPYRFNESYVRSEFVAHVMRAIEILLDSSKDIRDRHPAYILALRAALDSPEYTEGRAEFSALQSLLRFLCWKKFTGNQMTNYESALIELAIHGIPKEFNYGNIADAIEVANNKLHQCDRKLRKPFVDGAYQKIATSLGFYDPIAKSNVPEVRSIHTVKRGDDTYPILYLRHGAPTYRKTRTSPEEVVPEYRAFLAAADIEDQHVLYANHQSMVEVLSKMELANWTLVSPLKLEKHLEYLRATAISRLEENYPKFHFLSLPYDGEIWKNETLGLGNTASWKESIVAALVNQQHGFRLPMGYFTKGEEFSAIADKIHKLYFRNARSLSVHERKIFLPIFYSYVKEVIKARYNVKIMVSACKDNKDRGNASTGADEAIMNLRLGLENDDHALYHLYVRTLAPFIIKYDWILPDRLEVLLNLLNHLANLPGRVRKDIQEYNPVPGYSIEGQTPPGETEPGYIDVASAIPLRERKFESFAHFIETATEKAGRVLVPAAQSNLLYKKNFQLNELLNSLKQGIRINNATCYQLEDIANCLDMTQQDLLASDSANYLACLSDKATLLCEEGLAEFIKNHSPYPNIKIISSNNSPLISSKVEKDGNWTNSITQDYRLVVNLEKSEEEAFVRVTAQTDKDKNTLVTVQRLRIDET